MLSIPGTGGAGTRPAPLHPPPPPPPRQAPSPPASGRHNVSSRSHSERARLTLTALRHRAVTDSSHPRGHRRTRRTPLARSAGAPADRRAVRAPRGRRRTASPSPFPARRTSCAHVARAAAARHRPTPCLASSTGTSPSAAPFVPSRNTSLWGCSRTGVTGTSPRGGPLGARSSRHAAPDSASHASGSSHGAAGSRRRSRAPPPRG